MATDAPWLTHPVRGLRGPVPWAAVLRAGCGVGPVVAGAVAADVVAVGVMAGLGAMFATINDRPGRQGARGVRVGVPALGGALGAVAGALVAAYLPGWWAVPALAATGVVAGAVSAVGPVASATGMQLMVLAVVGAGMHLELPPLARGAALLGGAGWVVAVGALLPRPLRSAADGREVVAAVYDALGALLAAVGRGPEAAEAARRRLTAAYDGAYQALYAHRGTRPPAALRARLDVAGALSEAAVTLMWEARHGAPGPALDARVVGMPGRLASAVRRGGPAGPLAAPAPDTAGRAALHRAALLAAGVFDGDAAPPVGAVGPGAGDYLRRAAGPAGREYGARVAVTVAAASAVALWIGADHWYWLPATAAFLVKPDMGPLFSRAVTRAFGTLAGVLVFAALSAVAVGDRAVLVAAGAAALIPVAQRNFALQTAAVTPLLLALLQLGGQPSATWARLTDTLLACAVVLAVGLVPGLGGPRAQVSVRMALAERSVRAYGARTRAGEAEFAVRLRLRREAYRALADARRTVETASAEHPPFGRDSAGLLPVVTELERAVDAATAAVVRREQGTTGRRSLTLT
ncbi:FUSC family protein [Streptomyces sp. NPDC060194]|uniref:FUSC family protein n=1 Tax=Streptomyces sp. NPDC060194 TaxID=3347069 RepID=UPI00364B9AF9